MKRDQKETFKFFSDCLKAKGFDYRPSNNKEKLEDIDLVIWDPSDKTKVFALAIKKNPS